MLAVSSFYISSVGILPSLEVVGRVDKVNWSSLIQPNCPRHLYGWMGKIFWGARREFLLFIIIMSRIPFKKESLDVRIFRERQTSKICSLTDSGSSIQSKTSWFLWPSNVPGPGKQSVLSFIDFLIPMIVSSRTKDRSGQNLIVSILSHLSLPVSKVI